MLSVPYKIVDKPLWPGREVHIVNNDKYCGKILHFDEVDAQCSLHWHLIKDEVMYCNKGKFEIYYGWNKDGKTSYKTITLHPGDSFHISPGMIHSIKAKENNSELIEFSTTDRDSDSYKLVHHRSYPAIDGTLGTFMAIGEK